MEGLFEGVGMFWEGVHVEERSIYKGEMQIVELNIHVYYVARHSDLRVAL